MAGQKDDDDKQKDLGGYLKDKFTKGDKITVYYLPVGSQGSSGIFEKAGSNYVVISKVIATNTTYAIPFSAIAHVDF
jgi:hypothetical protein